MFTRRDQVTCIVVAMAVAGTGASLTMTGCEGLDYSARAEGTGIQIVGAIVVLAKYHASNRQKAEAEERARRALLHAAKPVHERRRAAAQADSRKKIAAVEKDYNRRISQAQRGPVASGSAGSAAASVAELEAEKQRTLARLEAERAADDALRQREFHSLAGIPTRGLRMGDTPASSGDSVPLASTRDTEAMMASAAAHLPKYVAVSVRPEGIAAEQGGKSLIMLWDTRRGRLVDGDVRVLDRTLRDGVDFKVDGYTARYASN
jgi:hypothetical protein